MAIVDHDNYGRFTIMEISIEEFRALGEVLCKANDEQFGILKPIMLGMIRELEWLNASLDDINKQLERHFNHAKEKSIFPHP